MRLNELPIEIIENISLRLETSEKFSLMLTCKRLKDTIYQRSLFDSVAVYGEEQTETTVLWFRDNPLIAQRVKTLQINIEYLSNQLCSELPLIFPRLEYFSEFSFEGENTRPKEVYNDFIRWKDTITRFEIYNDSNPNVLFKLLENNVFTCLTAINLSWNKDAQNMPNFVECIKNAPLLKFLSLTSVKLTINDIESIHTTSPLLSTFIIHLCMILVAEEETLPSEIVPADNMTHLSMEFVSIIDPNCLFLEYLTKKYITLAKLKLTVNFLGRSIRALFPNIEEEERNPSPGYIDTIRQILDTKEVYTNSASAALSNLPNTLKHLTIDVSGMKNAISIFAPKLTNLRHLTYFEVYGVHCQDLTDQIDMLKSLKKLTSLNTTLDPSIHKHSPEPLSTTVTDLKLRIKGKSAADDMDIGWLFSVFPSVDSMMIDWSGARLIGYKTTPPRVNHSLTKLQLGVCKPHDKLLRYINECAPNLKQLYWTITGEHHKKRIESVYEEDTIHVQFEESIAGHKRAYYKIDLTGFSLDCFYLQVDLNDDGWSVDVKDVCFCLKKKGKLKNEFILSKKYNHVSLESVSSKLPSKVKTKIQIKYDYTKKLVINKDTVIDLNESKITLGLI